MHNYADDTAITCSDMNYNTAHTKLLDGSEVMIHWFENNNLKANPKKFQLIGFDGTNKQRSLAIHGADLQSSFSVKLLGVQIDQSLLFTKHISQLCIKTGQKINVLSRLCHSLTSDAKLLLMQAFNLSHFNFCSIIWHYCSIHDLRKIEKLQYKALKYVSNDFTSSYAERSPLMFIERQTCILIELYQISPSYLHDTFKIKELHYGLRNDSIIALPNFIE